MEKVEQGNDENFELHFDAEKKPVVLFLKQNWNVNSKMRVCQMIHFEGRRGNGLHESAKWNSLNVADNKHDTDLRIWEVVFEAESDAAPQRRALGVRIGARKEG